MGFFSRLKKTIEVELWKRKKDSDSKTTHDIEIPVVFKVGAMGEYAGLEFEDIGQVKYDWGGGDWDECLLEFSDKKRKWLLIDELDFIIFDEEIPIKDTTINKGTNQIENKKIFIDAIIKATVTSSAGYSGIKEGTDIECYNGYDEEKNIISIRKYIGKYGGNTVMRIGKKVNRFDINVYG